MVVLQPLREEGQKRGGSESDGSDIEGVPSPEHFHQRNQEEQIARREGHSAAAGASDRKDKELAAAGMR